MFEKERVQMELDLREKFESRLNEEEKRLEKEKIEIARLKSLEQVRARKLEEKRINLENQQREAEMQIMREKAQIEALERNKKAISMERAEKKKKRTFVASP